MTPTSDASTPQLQIHRIASETLLVPIVGTAPLIVHKFSEKAKRAMLDNMQGRKAPKQKRDPQADYEGAMYRLKDGYGFPVTAFKAATIGAARYYGNDVKMTELRMCIFMHGQVTEQEPQALVQIHGEPRMREDYVRFGMSSTDLCYRPEFWPWSAELTITYVKSSLSRDSVLSLIDAGGMGGVGEWRPAGKRSSGECGTYKIDPTRQVEVLDAPAPTLEGVPQ